MVGVDDALQMGPQMELLAVLSMAPPCGLLGFKKQVSHLLFAFSDLAAQVTLYHLCLSQNQEEGA